VTEPEIGEEELKNVIEAVRSGWVSSKGKFIEEFENMFAKYVGVKYGVATSNGTAALHLALATICVKLYDEVIVPESNICSYHKRSVIRWSKTGYSGYRSKVLVS